MRTYYQIYLVLFYFYSITSFAQPKTNFELIDSLLYESVVDISGKLISDNSYSLNFIGADDYSILNQRMIEHFAGSGIMLQDQENSMSKIDFTMIDARTEYPEIFKDHVFGSYLIERTSEINYSYSIVEENERGMVFESTNSITDTVVYSDLPKLENVAYTFTSSEVPDEPLFSSAIEPVIAIGTAAVAVYLFFNIRSK